MGAAGACGQPARAASRVASPPQKLAASRDRSAALRSRDTLPVVRSFERVGQDNGTAITLERNVNFPVHGARSHRELEVATGMKGEYTYIISGTCYK